MLFCVGKDCWRKHECKRYFNYQNHAHKLIERGDVPIKLVCETYCMMCDYLYYVRN